MRTDTAARDVDRGLQQIAIHGSYAIDKQGNRFLLHDSRVQEPLLPVFFIFGTDSGLERLRDHPNCAGDGTFKVTPLAFLQLYTLNVLIDHSSIPAIWILMANRQKQTYR